jgi:cell division protein ZapD
MSMIIYEFPTTERIRTLLRIEDLFQRLQYFVDQTDSLQHHAALSVLFEMMEVATRGDLKSDMLQELEKQKKIIEQSILSHRNLNTPKILADIHLAQQQLLTSAGKFAQHLRENEWFMLLKQRMSIPGGSCEFDLPLYHYWLNLPVEERKNDFAHWTAPLVPIYSGISMVLKLLRETAKSESLLALDGAFQRVSTGRAMTEKPAQLLQVKLDSQYRCVPELSTNKYALNMRFMQAIYTGARPQKMNQDIPFELLFCSL